MYIKKVKLGVEDLTRLLSTGECECIVVGKPLKIGSCYEVWGADGYFVKVCGYDGEKYVLRKNDGELESTSRAKNEGERKVNITSRLDRGMFVGGKSKFDVGEEVAVAEDYMSIVHRYGEEGYKFIAKALGMEWGIEARGAIHASAGYARVKYVDARAMPRRIRIVSSEVRRVSSISDKEWLLLGVTWANKDVEINRKMQCVGRAVYLRDSEVVLYKYETVSGGVEHYSDAMSVEQRLETNRIMLSEGEAKAEEYQRKVAKELYEEW
jgi:hypothetical protein